MDYRKHKHFRIRIQKSKILNGLVWYHVESKRYWISPFWKLHDSYLEINNAALKLQQLISK